MSSPKECASTSRTFQSPPFPPSLPAPPAQAIDLQASQATPAILAVPDHLRALAVAVIVVAATLALLHHLAVEAAPAHTLTHALPPPNAMAHPHLSLAHLYRADVVARRHHSRAHVLQSAADAVAHLPYPPHALHQDAQQEEPATRAPPHAQHPPHSEQDAPAPPSRALHPPGAPPPETATLARRLHVPAAPPGADQATRLRARARPRREEDRPRFRARGPDCARFPGLGPRRRPGGRGRPSRVGPLAGRGEILVVPMTRDRGPRRRGGGQGRLCPRVVDDLLPRLMETLVVVEGVVRMIWMVFTLVGEGYLGMVEEGDDPLLVISCKSTG